MGLEPRKSNWRDARADESDGLEKRELSSNQTTHCGNKRPDLELLTTLDDTARHRTTPVDPENWGKN
jgi:hypothetical protein